MKPLSCETNPVLFQYQLCTQNASEQYRVAVQTRFTASRTFCSDIITSCTDITVYDFVRRRRATAEINTLGCRCEATPFTSVSN